MNDRFAFSVFCPTARRNVMLALCLALCTVAPKLSAQERKSILIEFDAPGAVNGTNGWALNPAGVVIGSYEDANYVEHSFLRAPDGTFTTFDPPGAVNGSAPEAINPQGAVTGIYLDASLAPHGFLRAPDGTFTSFDAPGAGPGPCCIAGTVASDSINPSDAITGYYYDVNSVVHGYLRERDGTFTTFEAPGAGTGAFEGTYALSINPAGTILGSYGPGSHGFLRTADGNFTNFDPPGAMFIAPASIDPAGEVAGYYGDANYVDHGFLRATDGALTTFDAPGAGIGTNFNQGTLAKGINPAGVITGYYVDASNVAHGFLRARDGAFITFDAPDAGADYNGGTFAVGINPAGVITGFYYDADFVSHGFVRIP
ncbi:MAG: hypothetical protein ABSH52_05290 [Terriglobia bacterium]|jgi:hypothetical protein